MLRCSFVALSRTDATQSTSAELGRNFRPAAIFVLSKRRISQPYGDILQTDASGNSNYDALQSTL